MSKSGQLTLAVVRDFFLFREAAFKTVASHPAMMWVGPLMVLAAGFAREYDHEYLLAEPWHLLLPLVASAIGILALSIYLFLFSFPKLSQRVSYVRQLHAIASIYWMTAPLAWLYAFPIEHFSEPISATKVNLGFLLIVSIYRVALMSLGVRVLYGIRWFDALSLVLLFSDVLAFAALYYMPAPIFLDMGGIELSPNEKLIQTIKMFLTLLTVLAFPFLFLGNLYLFLRRRNWSWFERDSHSEMGVSRGVVYLVLVQLIFGLGLFGLMLPEQALQWRMLALLKQRDFDGAITLSLEYPRDRFPPHMDLPPRITYGDPSSELYLVYNSLFDRDPTSWLLPIFRKKIISDSIDRQYEWIGYDRLSNDGLQQYVRVVSSFDHPRTLIEPQRWLLASFYEREEDIERKELLLQLLHIGGFDENGEEYSQPMGE